MLLASCFSLEPMMLSIANGCLELPSPFWSCSLILSRRMFLCVKRFPGTVVARGALRHVAEGLLHALEPLAPPQEASILEHGAAFGMQRPVASLTRLIGTSGNLNKAVVEREVVAKGVLPPLLVLPVEGKVVDDELVDLG